MFTKKAVTIVASIFLTILLTSSNQAISAPTPQKIPAGIVETSKKLNLWRDIYTSSQKVVVYSYIPGSTCPYQSQEFHNKVSTAATNSAGKYKVRPIGPDKLKKEVNTAISKVEAKAKNVSSQEGVQQINKEIQSLNQLLTFTNKCTIKACIINPSKGEYILMERKPAEAVQTMKQYLR